MVPQVQEALGLPLYLPVLKDLLDQVPPEVPAFLSPQELPEILVCPPPPGGQSSPGVHVLRQPLNGQVFPEVLAALEVPEDRSLDSHPSLQAGSEAAAHHKSLFPQS